MEDEADAKYLENGLYPQPDNVGTPVQLPPANSDGLGIDWRRQEAQQAITTAKPAEGENPAQ